MGEVIAVNFQNKLPSFSHHRQGKKIMAQGSFDRIAHTTMLDGVDPMEMLRLYLYHLAIIGFDNWDEGEDNRAVFDAANDLIEDYLCTAEGEPAEKNIAWLRKQGWRVNIVRKHDKDVEFWYGEVYVWGPYYITFKWTGQRSAGV